jgi:hypothetical protein
MPDLTLVEVVAVAGFSVIASLVGVEFTLLPLGCAIVYAVNPAAGAFAGLVVVLLGGGVARFIKAGR